MLKALLVVSLAVIVRGQYGGLEYNNIPNPYSFSYNAPSEGGESTHQESGDGQGRVTGSYTVVNEDGSSRTVEYVADENGFRPSITTNEPGTSNQAPADVIISSSAEDGIGGVGAQFGAVPGPASGGFVSYEDAVPAPYY